MLQNFFQHNKEFKFKEALVLCGLAFLIFASYALARPTLKSLLISHYTKDALPIAWLIVGVVVTATVMVYSRFAATMSLKHLYQRVIAVCCVTLVIGMLLYQIGLTWVVFLLFVWKDVYIVVLAEMFWSMASGLFHQKQAKWIYGFFCALGSLGGMTANFAVGPIANKIGTDHTPWMVIPVLLSSAFVVRFLPDMKPNKAKKKQKVDYIAGFRTVKKSSYLIPLMAIIALIQVAITLIDYQCSGLVEVYYDTKDARTAIFGQMYGYIDIISLCLQLSSGLILSLIGVGGTLMGVPLILAGCLTVFLAAPSFLVMSIALIAGKSMDYSIYRAAKELLYLPLTREERTQGKAVIDMMTYRVAKGAASMTILVLAMWTAPTWALSTICLVLISGWFLCTWVLLPRYQKAAQDTPKEPLSATE